MKSLHSYIGGIWAVILGLFVAALTGLKYALMGPPTFRARTCDVAIGYRMQAGFPGDINRTHPFSVLPALVNTTTPPAAYGGPVIVNTADSTVRGIASGDGSVTPGAVYGFLVRPYPTQQSSGGMSSAAGAITPPVSGICDVLRNGYIFAKLPAGATVTKGGTVYVWAAATSGNNIQGQLVAASSTTNTLTITNASFVGPADANGNVEIEIRPA
jgi:hypothetical protein